MRNFEDLKYDLLQAKTADDVIRICEKADQDFLTDKPELEMRAGEWAEWSAMVCAKWKELN